MPSITNLSDRSVKKSPTQRMTASTHLETALSIAYWALNSLYVQFRVLYARRNVDIRLIEPEVSHSGRGTIIDAHTTKQKAKIYPRVTRPDLPLQGSGGNQRSTSTRVLVKSTRVLMHTRELGVRTSTLPGPWVIVLVSSVDLLKSSLKLV